ncbi:putative ribonuclease H-like domain-containing protein, partial [Tanacetum coccineum]
SPILSTRIHKDHPRDQVIGDLQSATQTRKMSKNLKEHGFEEPKKVIHALKDPSSIKAMQEELLQFKLQRRYTREEGIDYDEVFALVARIEAIRLFLAYASFKDFVVYQMDVKNAFLYRKIEEEVNLGLLEVKTASIPIETSKASTKDVNGVEVDVQMFVHDGSLMIFSDYAGASLDRKSTTGGCQFLGCRLISWQCKKQTVVANSITEAEYVAASSCCGQVLWIQNQLLDYGFASKAFDVPQPSDPSKNVKDEAVHKELGDSLVRVATTVSSLEAEQDSDCQETMGDTIAQTRFENVSKLSNDSLLAREKTKTTQANEISSLKRRVKKLEKKRSEDASKQGRRINAIDADEDITLVNVQDDADNEMFDVNVLNGEDVFVAGQNENVVEEVVDVAQVSTAAITVIITTEEITLAQALEALKTSKPKGYDTGTYKAKKEKEANIALIEEWDDIQAKIDADYQLAERMQAQEQEELSDAEKDTLFQQLLDKRRKHFAAKRAEEQRNKPPT